MDKLGLNEKLEISAPHGRIEYLENGDFKINPLIKNKRPDLFKGIENVCLIAVGTGITPMWQMLEAILSNSSGNLIKINNINNIKVKFTICILRQKENYFGLRQST